MRFESLPIAATFPQWRRLSANHPPTLSRSLKPAARYLTMALVLSRSIISWNPAHESSGIVQLDSWLEPFQDTLRRRFGKAQEWIKNINDHEGGLDRFSRVCASQWIASTQLLTRLGIRNVGLQCVQQWGYCLPRMGSECLASLFDRRLQYDPSTGNGRQV